MSNKIRVIIVEPNKEPLTVKIKNILEEKQKIVGGLIQFCELEHNIDLIYNEESKILNLDFNRIIKNDVVCGIFIIAGQKNGYSISLSRKQIQKCKKEFLLNKHKLAIDFLRRTLINSSNLLNLNLSGVERLKKLKK